MTHSAKLLAGSMTALLLLACAETSTSGSGGAPEGAGGAGGDAQGGGGHGGGPADPLACLDQATDADCLAMGCLVVPGKLFPELVCAAGEPVSICVWYNQNEGLQSPEAWRRETVGGLLTLGTGHIPAQGPYGFEACGADSLDEERVCQCFEEP